MKAVEASLQAPTETDATSASSEQPLTEQESELVEADGLENEKEDMLEDEIQEDPKGIVASESKKE